MNKNYSFETISDHHKSSICLELDTMKNMVNILRRDLLDSDCL